jgi:hypothetical protein
MTGDDPLLSLAEEYLAALLRGEKHLAGRSVIEAVDREDGSRQTNPAMLDRIDGSQSDR